MSAIKFEAGRLHFLSDIFVDLLLKLRIVPLSTRGLAWVAGAITGFELR